MRRRSRGHTLAEIMFAGALLLVLLGLLAGPLTLTSKAMKSGQARLDSQQQLREPLDRMLMLLRTGSQMTVSAPTPSPTPVGGEWSNSATVHDNDNRELTFRLDAATHQIVEDIKEQAGGTFVPIAGSPVRIAGGISRLRFSPQYEMEPSPGVWAPYALPIPSKTTAAFAPDTNGPLSPGTLVLIQVVGIESPDAPRLDYCTSIYLRN